MRYLRRQVINRRAPFDSRLVVDITNGIVMNTTNSLLMPKGSTTDQPVAPVTGMMRYNTTTNEVEVYQGIGGGSTWRALRFKEATQITQQSLGDIDGYTYFYGPLNPMPPAVTQSGSTWSGANLLVFVENVFQVFNRNFVISQNPTASGLTTLQTIAGSNTLTFADTSTFIQGAVASGTNIPVGTTATIISETEVLLSNPVTGGDVNIGDTISFSAFGYYVDFTSDPDYLGLIGKPVIVLHGFDK